MSTLFTIKESLFARSALYEQLFFASEGDSIVLMEDAVLALQSPIALSSFVAKANNFGICVYAMASDIELRGVEIKQSEVKVIDYDTLVDLVIDHDKQLAW